MKRLTNHFAYCEMINCKFYDAELFKQGKCKFFDQSIEHCYEKKLVDKLREYEDAEDQDLLIILPCKIGDVLYYMCKGRIKELIVSDIRIRKYYTDVFTKDVEDERYAFSSGEIGKSIFMTIEEAEAALERMSGGKNGNE